MYKSLHVDSWADSHAMLRVFRELVLKQNGETCIWEAVPAYILWTNSSLKWLY